MDRTPLTTKQAYLKYACSECKSGGDCGYDCVESGTCSFSCPECKERVWFLGNSPDAPQFTTCPYCKRKIKAS